MEDIKFEQALTRLEKIVENLEAGELPLEEALKKFEEGIGLSRLCAKKLDEAQQRVDILLADEDGTKKTKRFEIQQAGDGDKKDE